MEVSSPAQAPSPLRQPLQILLIEENPTDVSLIQALLDEVEGVSLACVRTMADATAHLDQEMTDVILLGLSEKDAQAPQNLSYLKGRLPFTPLVVLTDAPSAGLRSVTRSTAEAILFKEELERHLLVRTLSHAMEKQRLLNELAAAESLLEEASLADPTTKLLNRRGLTRSLAQLSFLSQRIGKDLLVLLMSVDNLAQVYEMEGQTGGDQVLLEVANRLRGTLRGSDRVARLEGDEFLVLMPQTKLGEGLRVAERLRLVVSNAPILLSTSKAVRLTVNLGLAEATQESPAIDDLLTVARRALQQSKAQGKNRIAYQTGEGAGGAGHLLTDVVSTLCSGDSLFAVKQSIHGLSDERKIGYEMFCRSTLSGFENPEAFFRLAGEVNKLPQLDQQCLVKCLSAASKTEPNTRIHVNLFPATLLRIDTADLVRCFPFHKGPRKYCIELSERHLVGDPAAMVSRIADLNRAGIVLAIDNIGFGMRCLESLILLKPSFVKVDHQCIQGIAKDSGKVRFLKRFMAAVKNLRVEVIADGIETREDKEVLLGLGVAYGQGQLWGAAQ